MDPSEPLEDVFDHPASRRQRLAAGLLAMFTMLVTLGCALFGEYPVGEIPAVLPTVFVATAVCELLTAYLLGVHYALRPRALLVGLIWVYVLDAVMAMAYVVCFPGTFRVMEALALPPFTALWVWLSWQWSYPIGILLAVALHLRYRNAPNDRREPKAVLWLLPVLAAALICFVAIRVQHVLPPLVTPQGQFTIGSRPLGMAWVLDLVALIALISIGSLRRELGTFLCVSALAMFAYAVTGVNIPFRFSLAWYAAAIMKAIASTGLLAALLWQINRLYRELQQTHRTLQDISLRDGLTGLSNRRHLEQQLAREFSRAQRHAQPLAVLMIDVDHFKAYNDRFGHLQGDDCLVAVAGALQGLAQRAGDCIARYGGEEFLLMFPGADRAGGERIAESARVAVRALGLQNGTGTGVVTISVGVAVHSTEQPCSDRTALVAAADAALYQAKRDGRDRVCVAAALVPV